MMARRRKKKGSLIKDMVKVALISAAIALALIVVTTPQNGKGGPTVAVESK
jgi:hypothetical protein